MKPCPAIHIKELTFNDGMTITLNPNDLVVLVGPNNSGKSASLREIYTSLRDTCKNNRIIKNLAYQKTGSFEELLDWFRANFPDTILKSGSYRIYDTQITSSSAESFWKRPESNGFHTLVDFFCNLLTAERRLTSSNPPQNISLSKEAPRHPIHKLQKNDTLELKISELFRKAFGCDLIVHRNAGDEVPLYVGRRPEKGPGEDRLSLTYQNKIEQLSPLQFQGDGMRSFVGVMLNSFLTNHSILLLDEPEAFLHPPQARMLGRMVAKERRADTQVFIATHSSDILRGIIDSNAQNVRVIRLNRIDNINHVRELNNEQIRELWKDPLLRYSNILDGLFHDKTVVCESDSDCRFYNAVFEALLEKSEDSYSGKHILFTHCSGKYRLPTVIKALRQLGVPTAVIADFDVLREETLLKSILTSLGGDWAEAKSNWKTIKNSIDTKKPEASPESIKRSILIALNQVTGDKFPETASKEIIKTLKSSSPWSSAKSMGAHFIPNGQPSVLFKDLISVFKKSGLFVVEVGELENFSKSISEHGPSWVNTVIQKDLINDSELRDAREFVSEVTAV